MGMPEGRKEMAYKVRFWRTSHGGNGKPEKQSVVKTYFFFAPDDMSEEAAIEMAKSEICAWAGVSDWREVASGYDLGHTDLEAEAVAGDSEIPL